MKRDGSDLPIEKRVWTGSIVETSEGLKKILHLLQILKLSDDSPLQQFSDPPEGKWISKGLSDHFSNFLKDIELLKSIPRLLEGVLNAPYQNADFFLLSSLWCTTSGFNPDLVIEIGRSVGGTTISLITASKNCSGLKAIVTVDTNAFWWEKTVEKFGTQIDQSRLFVVNHDARYVPWGKVIAHSRRPFIFFDAHDAPGVPLMTHLIGELIEPCLDRQFLVFIDNVRYVSDPQKLVQMDRPEKWDSKGFCNQLWNGEIYCGFAEVVSLIDWLNKNHTFLHKPKEEFLGLVTSHQELKDLRYLPELPWPHGAVYFSHLDFFQ